MILGLRFATFASVYLPAWWVPWVPPWWVACSGGGGRSLGGLPATATSSTGIGGVPMEAAAGVDAAVLQPAPPRTCVSGRRRGDGRGACYCESVEVPGSWWHLTGGVGHTPARTPSFAREGTDRAVCVRACVRLLPTAAPLRSLSRWAA